MNESNWENIKPINKTALIIDALTENPEGIDINYIEKETGLSLIEFYSRKSKINNNKKKWKDIQVIRSGQRGNSKWKLAQNNPKQTMKYNTQLRDKQIINSFLCKYSSNIIALAAERSIKEQKRMTTEITNSQQKVLQAITNPQGYY